MKKIKLYSGVSIEHKCREQLHPVSEVNKAIELINDLDTQTLTLFSNSTDFIGTIKYYGEKKEVELEFFLDYVSHGDDIEPLFEDFNKSFDIINIVTQ